jgi:hypothetical protein
MGKRSYRASPLKRRRSTTRPTKQTDRRSKNFGEISVDDAIEPAELRRIVQAAIEDHLPSERLGFKRLNNPSVLIGNLVRSVAAEAP